jgi:manganese transport protein
MKRLLSVLFWSVIAAAFIGPGTVTTTASSGASHGLRLLWAVLFSTLACLALQEASARITSVSGLTLGRALRKRYRGRMTGLLALGLVLGAVVLGCAAYEAGNILGALAGATMFTGLPPLALTLGAGAAASALLALGTARTVAKALGVVVAFMGVAFLVTALMLRPALPELAEGLLVPSFPPGSGILVLGLIGTTVVPYNLFLGSGLALGQSLREIRFGLSVAVLLGGVISMGILVAGTSVQEPFSFEVLAEVLSAKLGIWAGPLFALGLFAAGFSSAITAPLAAALTVRSLFARDEQDTRWTEGGWRYRAVWGAVLLTGVGFGLAGVQPVPAILLAQAFNGVLLPFVAAFLLIVSNDRNLLSSAINGRVANGAQGLVFLLTVLLGSWRTLGAGSASLGLPAPDETLLIGVSAVVAAAAAWPLFRAAARARSPEAA